MKLSDVDQDSDAALVEYFLASGDRQVLSILYQRYAEPIYRKCVAMLHEEENAKDLTHDIFLKAFLKLASLKDQARFGPWLRRITYNMCIDYLNLRRDFRTESLDEGMEKDISVEENSREDKILLEINLEQLERLLKQLPDADRIILLMRYQDDMSIKELQEILSLGSSAVKMRLKRAKDKLAGMYTQQLDQAPSQL